MILNDFSYINIPQLTGNIETDVKNMLESNNKSDTLTHISKVAEVNSELAKRFGLDADKCIASGFLHDISAVVKPEDMLIYAEENRFDLCEAEHRFPFILHQRISEVIAREHFDIKDTDILSPIKFHTTLRENPTKYEMSLFIADKLAWDENGTPPFYSAVKAALDCSLEKACYEYMTYMNDSGSLLLPHNNWTLGYDWLKEGIVQ